MNDNGYSITLILFDWLVNPSMMHMWTCVHMNQWDTHGYIENFQYPKGRTILNWGRYNHNKPMSIPKSTHEKHTPVQTMATYKTHHTMVYKPMFYLWFHTYHHITYVKNNRKNYRENNRSYWLSKIWNIIWNNRIFQLGLSIENTIV